MKVIEMNIDKPLLNGTLLKKSIDNWDIIWETNENYRHWCLQKHPENDKTALLILFNPGSLNSNPDSLNKDTTLRVLREVFHKTGFNTFVINLFDYCIPDYRELKKNWKRRDYKSLVYEKLITYDFIFSMYAYGSINKNDIVYNDLISRINLVKNTFKHLSQFKYDGLKTTHPLSWQLQKKKTNIHQVLLKAYEKMSNSFSK